MPYVLLLGLLTASAPDTGSWRAGAAKIAITPEKSMWMSGYAARTRPADGKWSDLWAKALVIEDRQGARAVLVTMDLVGIDRHFSQLVCGALAKEYALPRESI